MIQNILGPSWLPKVGAILGATGLAVRKHPSPNVNGWADVLETIGIALVGLTARQNNVTSETAGAAAKDPAASKIASTLGVLP